MALSGPDVCQGQILLISVRFHDNGGFSIRLLPDPHVGCGHYAADMFAIGHGALDFRGIGGESRIGTQRYDFQVV